MRGESLIPAVFLGIAAAILAALGSLQGVAVLAGIGAAAYLGGTLHRPRIGLLLLLPAIPFAMALPGSMLFKAVNYAAPAIILGSWLIHRLRARDRTRSLPSPLGSWFAVFILWMAISSLFAVNPESAGVQVLRYGLLALVLLAFHNHLSRNDLARGLLLYALVLIPTAVLALGQLFARGPSEVIYTGALEPWRISSIFENPNTFGLVMANGAVILASVLLVPRSPRPAIQNAGLALGLVLLLAGLVFSFSRASFLYAAVSLILLAACRRKPRAILIGGVILVGTLVLILPLPDWVSIGLRIGAGLSLRGELWSSGLAILADHPLTGIGTGADAFQVERTFYLGSQVNRVLYDMPGGGAHNVFIDNGASLGIPGVLLTVAVFAVLWMRVPGGIRSFREGDWLSGAGVAAVIGLTFHGLFESGASVGSGRVSDSIIFFLFAVILLAGGKDSGRERERGSPLRAS